MKRSFGPVALAAIIATGGMDGAIAQDSSRRYDAVLCTSQSNGPWTLKGRGTLTRTKTRNELIYKLEVGEQIFDWRFVTNAQGATTATGPGFLMDRFAEPPSDPGARRQSLEATGEIREYAASSSLVLIIGSRCPKGR